MRPGIKAIPAVLLLAVVVTASLAAPRLVPPTQYMRQERFRSAVAKVVEITDEGRIRIEVLEQLYGESPDGLVVRFVSGFHGQVEVGKTYIIGHTDKPSRRTRRFDTDPDGSRVLNVPVVGFAVFENSSAMRTLVRAHSDDAPLTDRQRLDAMIEQLPEADVQSRRFVLTELALDSALRDLVGEPELEVLRATVASGELEPVAHDYLLRAARQMIGTWGAEWLAIDCRALVASHGAELDLWSPIPSLLVTALEILAEVGVPADAEQVRKHVPSNNPGAGKAAFAALVSLDPDLALEIAAKVVEDESIHVDTRRFVARAAAELQPTSGSD